MFLSMLPLLTSISICLLAALLAYFEEQVP